MRIQTLTATDLFSVRISKFKVDGTLVVMPCTNLEMARRASDLMSKRAKATGLILMIFDDANAGFVQIVNRLFRISESAYFAYVAQDVFPGRDWLITALNALGDDNHFLGFNDGKWAGALASFGLVRRSWAIKQYAGDFFYSGYRSHYADAELTLVAIQQAVYAYDPNSILIEVDWEKDEKPISAEDRKLFLSRRSTQFDMRVTDVRILEMLS